MEGTLTQQRRVSDDGLRVVKLCRMGRVGTVPFEEASANYVPAAAVRRRGRALSGITGRKELVGGCISLCGKISAQQSYQCGYCSS